MGFNFILNMLIAGRMDKLCSIMNSLQVVQYIRLFKVKTPGNVNSFTDFFDGITSVEVYDTSDWYNEWMYIPEQEPISLNF